MGLSSPASRLKSVDLPEPLRPLMQTNSPSSDSQVHAIHCMERWIAAHLITLSAHFLFRLLLMGVLPPWPGMRAAVDNRLTSPVSPNFFLILRSFPNPGFPHQPQYQRRADAVAQVEEEAGYIGGACCFPAKRPHPADDVIKVHDPAVEESACESVDAKGNWLFSVFPFSSAAVRPTGPKSPMRPSNPARNPNSPQQNICHGVHGPCPNRKLLTDRRQCSGEVSCLRTKCQCCDDDDGTDRLEVR